MTQSFIARIDEQTTLRDADPRLADSLDDYVTKRYETGSFLRSCLENDFVEAACRADCMNRHRLHLIAKYIFNRLPADCWGSKEKVTKWLAGEGHGVLEGT